jgi:DNA helicase-2/ATP-dependent DNA helicase PcrA
MDYLDGLNDSQRIAVEKIDGPIMVIAGAGSGKTRVLTYRIAHMIRKGIDPFNVMALTFTNKAAKEMNIRISDILGGSEAKNITMGTFHSVFSRILRFNADLLGYPTNFTIYDTADSKSLIKSVIKDLNLDDKTYKPSMVLGRISSAKNSLISPEDYKENSEIMNEDKLSGRPELHRIYAYYANKCKKAGAMDFDDLLYKTNVLLRDFPDVLQYYQQKFKYILVDEYQDTNYAQYLIVKKIAAAYQNLCVVGDDAQSIYSFRGANIQNILNFKNDYPDFSVFKLEQNYRSTKSIVEAANSVISQNKDQIQKTVWTDNELGAPISIVKTLTDNEEGKIISSKIYDLKMSQGIDYSSFAILYRTNRQSRSFEESFRKLNLPYKIYGGLSFYQRKEIKDLLAYFRLATNPQDEEALKRVINYPKRGIGKTSIESLIIASNTYGVSIWEVISDFSRFPVSLNGTTKIKLSEFRTMIESFHVQLEKQSAYDLAFHIAKSSGILKDLHGEKDKGQEEVERYQNIEELLSGIRSFSATRGSSELNTLPGFMMDVALLTDADNEDDDDKNKITLMTIHSSKGLEFPHVFLVGLEENLFPSQMSLNTRSELEEERRLFYVALTRAEKTCTISYAVSRFVFGSLTSSEPSRFISEINREYIAYENPHRNQIGGRSLNGGRSVNIDQPMTGGLNKKMESPKNLRSLNDLLSKPTSKSNNEVQLLKVGYNVSHELFGNGKVISIEGEGDSKKAVVFFPKEGSKNLLLKFAKLQILE